MIHPTKADLGRTVIYREPSRPDVQERGVLTKFNEDYAFVRYMGDLHSKATPCANLIWEVADDEED